MHTCPFNSSHDPLRWEECGERYKEIISQVVLCPKDREHHRPEGTGQSNSVVWQSATQPLSPLQNVRMNYKSIYSFQNLWHSLEPSTVKPHFPNSIMFLIDFHFEMGSLCPQEITAHVPKETGTLFPLIFKGEWFLYKEVICLLRVIWGVLDV